jgi:hypothetical protein
MGNITALDIGSAREKLVGNSIDIFRAGSSETAGETLLNQFDPDDANAKQLGIVDNTEGVSVSSAPSQFNPFNVFRYKGFAASEKSYDIKNHSDKNLYGGNISGLSEQENRSKDNLFAYIRGAIDGASGETQKYSDNTRQKSVRNPTAKQIIDSSKDTTSTTIGPAPYAYNDFIYCTHYGKIPNNRLVTLRRYPQPVEDNLFITPKEKDPDYIQVPIAQALTYFGEGTGNTLNKILPISWDMKWTALTADVKDIAGNEVLIDDVVGAAGITNPDTQNAIRVAIAALSGTNQLSVTEIAGYDKILQEYIRNSYNSEKGPYWNRVLGPVNVINQSRKRDRGMGSTMFETPVNLEFRFSLRSFNFINPKVAMLDLLSNFLSLTYNTAPFWGGGYRYFQNPGVKVSLAGQDLINEGKVLEGIQATLKEWLSGANGVAKNLINQLAGSFSNVSAGSASSNTEAPDLEEGAGQGIKDFANLMLAGRASALMQTPMTYRSLLEGRPIGEWHLTVGNPLDPMAVMGNLICTSCVMTFSDELGADDFPKEIIFRVDLKHGRPRAKQDLESIFNLGGGPLSFSQLNPPSSADQTFGDNPANNVINGIDQGTETNPSSINSNVNLTNTTDEELREDISGQPGSKNTVDTYRARVANHYGENFGKSSMLTDYIIKTKT